MRLLILNSGSSSLKFQIIQVPEESAQIEGILEGIGQDRSALHIKQKDQEIIQEAKVPDHNAGLQLVLEQLKKTGIDLKSIEAVGHRVVHGGEKYKAPVFVTDQVARDIGALSEIAPLHNPANLAGIAACRKLFPAVPNIAVFDTAFHQTLPPKAYLYGLPYELYEKFGIRRPRGASPFKSARSAAPIGYTEQMHVHSVGP